MPGTLTNLTRRALTFNLTTKVAPVRHLFPRREERADGGVSVVEKRVVVPDSITVLSKSTLENLPDGVPFCPEVGAALKRGDVKWTPQREARVADLPRAKATTTSKPEKSAG